MTELAHPDEIALWRAVLDADDPVRVLLVLADWLEEQGDPRASIVRTATAGRTQPSSGVIIYDRPLDPRHGIAISRPLNVVVWVNSPASGRRDHWATSSQFAVSEARDGTVKVSYRHRC